MILIIITAAIISIGGLLYIFIKLLKLREKYNTGLEVFIKQCRPFKAIVLDVNNSIVEGVKTHAVILQFRDEIQRKTIVHRYTISHRNGYKRGDTVTIYYNDKTDSACVIGDNPFSRIMFRCLIGAFLAFLLAIIITIALIISLFWFLLGMRI